MFCPQCGAANDETDRFCRACGLDLSRRTRPDATADHPQDYQQDYQQDYAGDYQQTYPQDHQAYRPAYQTPPSHGGGRHVPSYMGWAIVVLLFCFWPTGIAAVVNAGRVGNQVALGDIAGAEESSRRAKMWCWASLGIAVVLWLMALLLWYFYYREVLDLYNPYDLL
ncbi:MAG: CD225/dispanin family protein [Thermoleophilia bacterium]|nr:CD225/dispanin family protein [Thermoleophilia bacterium]